MFRWLALSLVVLVLCLNVVPAAGQEAEQKNCEPALINAIHERDLAAVKSLIHSGADLNAKDCHGAKALNEAIALRLPDEIVEELVLSGASPNAVGLDDDPPLNTASWYCRERVVQFLLAHGAHVNAVQARGYSALLDSAQNCKDGRVPALLLRAGANVNFKAANGRTALFVASFYGNEHTVHVLVAAGADLEAKDEDGQDALTIARDRDTGRKESHDRIYQFLLEASRRGKTGQPIVGEPQAIELPHEGNQSAGKAKKLFVEGPVLVLPVSQDFWYSFDWDAVLKLDDHLTFYGGDVKVGDQWGILYATEGALLVRENGRILRVQVPAPADSTKVPLVGKGWSLNPGADWKVAPSARAGDFALRRPREQ